MTLTPKTSRDAHYSFRINRKTLNRLHELANQLQTSLPDLLITGALMLASQHNTAAGYLQVKAHTVARQPSKRNP